MGKGQSWARYSGRRHILTAPFTSGAVPNSGDSITLTLTTVVGGTVTARHRDRVRADGEHHPSGRFRGSSGSTRPLGRLRADDHRSPSTSPCYGQSTRMRPYLWASNPNYGADSSGNGVSQRIGRRTGRSVYHQRRAVQRHGLRIQSDERLAGCRDNRRHADELPVGAAAQHPINRNPPGGANSDYTAADFQHMLLAAQVSERGRPAASRRSPRCTGRHWCDIGPIKQAHV